jgi:hypothetical protein
MENRTGGNKNEIIEDQNGEPRKSSQKRGL